MCCSWWNKIPSISIHRWIKGEGEDIERSLKEEPTNNNKRNLNLHEEIFEPSCSSLRCIKRCPRFLLLTSKFIVSIYPSIHPDINSLTHDYKTLHATNHSDPITIVYDGYPLHNNLPLHRQMQPVWRISASP